MTTTGDADIGRTLGYLEGRMDEQSALLQQIVAQMEQFNARLDEINARFNQIDTRFNQIDAHFNRVDGRIDRLYFAAFGIGSGIIAGLIGVVVTLIVQGQKSNRLFELCGGARLSSPLASAGPARTGALGSPLLNAQVFFRIPELG